MARKKRFFIYIVGNKEKGRISNGCFKKTKHMYVCVSGGGGGKCSFFEKFGGFFFFFFETPVLRLAL